MRLITWNIFDGAIDRWPLCAHWLATQKADVVALCECNDWNATITGERCAALALPHSIHCATPFGYDLCVGSREPFTLVAALGAEAGFWHGALHLRLAACDLILTHLAPGPERAEQRAREAALLLQRVQALERPALLTGDLNAASPADADFYAAAGCGIACRHTAIGILLDGGLVDLGAGQRPRWSVPTPLVGGDYRLRFDYTFANAAAAAQGGTALLHHEPPTDRASDHFPLVTNWSE